MSMKLTRPAVTTGECPLPASRRVTQYYAGNEIPLSSGSIRSPIPILKFLNLTQAVLDGLAAIFWVFFLAALAGSLPLAVALMLFAEFH
ncbi:hypothetical protein [Bradyrhizobium sp. LA2.1]|uniref:hypothetical protein n=1 Tax=Bradyrhizobium sp. LA2.1 TaxID=3156376 RepID=UPI0033910485